jgi:radical SAM protein with 4Fe4S-binding SPASM domain
MQKVLEQALALGVPLSAHLDLTYACNERCVHCYLEHQSPGEMNTTEVCRLLYQLADAGTLFLTLSGGEIFLRRDLFQIIECARQLSFAVKLKTNGTLIGLPAALRLKELGVQLVDISIYSHRAEVHDAITRRPGSLQQSVSAIRVLCEAGVPVRIASVLMRQNQAEIAMVRRLAEELGTAYVLDPTVTPKIDGDHSVLIHRADRAAVREVLQDPILASDTQMACEADDPAPDSLAANVPCSAGHSLVYIDPCGRVYPCVQFPLQCGDLRQEGFAEIWKKSEPLQQVRAIRVADLPVCSSCPQVSRCSRCPGLALMEGDMRGPSRADCEKAGVLYSIGCGEISQQTGSVLPVQPGKRPELVQIS